MARTGFEANSLTACPASTSQQTAPVGVADLYAFPADSAPTDPDLAELIDRWPALPEVVRTAVMAMVRRPAEGGETG